MKFSDIFFRSELNIKKKTKLFKEKENYDYLQIVVILM